jgi:ElaB/YqjD/DUF883 family membrane-anchored ribosome-binding protein
MPAAANKDNDNDLRKEFDALKDQVNSLLELLKEKEQEKAANIKDEITDRLEDYEEKAKEQMQHAIELGSENLDKVGAKIQSNPLTSLALAFGVGYLLSRVISKNE